MRESRGWIFMLCGWGLTWLLLAWVGAFASEYAFAQTTSDAAIASFVLAVGTAVGTILIENGRALVARRIAAAAPEPEPSN